MAYGRTLSISDTTVISSVHLRALGENLGCYVRVVPNWAKETKRAVDKANR